MANQAIRVAVIGMGGFAGTHHGALRRLEQEGACRVVAGCDPRLADFQEAMEAWEFAKRGVQVFPEYTQMLDACATECDMVTIPTPVPLHAPMHRAGVDRGLACYLEKPPTLDDAEMEEMLAVEARAAKQTMVGFSFIVQPIRQSLKRRLLGGEFGALREVRYLGVSPRATSYFLRAPWAGRLRMDGKLVLDSCLGNAMAHFLHDLHFWAGTDDLFAWEEVESMQAEMYRAHAIEGTDTIFLRGVCANGVVLQAAATHACDGPDHHQIERVECEKATLCYDHRSVFRIEWKDGRQETITEEDSDLLTQNFRAYLGYLRGEASRPVTRLADSRPFVRSYDLAYIAAQQITPVAEEHLHRSAAPNQPGEYVAINNIVEACQEFFSKGRFPSEQGMAWASPGGQAAASELPHLHSVIERMSG